jgi:hypothetical protein
MKMAGADVFGGEEIFENFFVFSINQPLNNHFENNDINDMNFLPGSGSLVIPIIPMMLGSQIMMYSLNRCAMRNYKNRKFRKFGRWIYQYQSGFGRNILIYLSEGYLDIVLSLAL